MVGPARRLQVSALEGVKRERVPDCDRAWLGHINRRSECRRMNRLTLIGVVSVICPGEGLENAFLRTPDRRDHPNQAERPKTESQNHQSSPQRRHHSRFYALRRCTYEARRRAPLSVARPGACSSTSSFTPSSTRSLWQRCWYSKTHQQQSSPTSPSGQPSSTSKNSMTGKQLRTRS